MADVQLVAAPTMAQVTPVAVEFLYTVTAIVLVDVFPTATLRLANVPLHRHQGGDRGAARRGAPMLPTPMY